MHKYLIDKVNVPALRPRKTDLSSWLYFIQMLSEKKEKSLSFSLKSKTVCTRLSVCWRVLMWEHQVASQGMQVLFYFFIFSPSFGWWGVFLLFEAASWVSNTASHLFTPSKSAFSSVPANPTVRNASQCGPYHVIYFTSALHIVVIPKV